MKQILFLFFIFLTVFSVNSYSQNYVIDEDFESLPLSLTSSSTGTGVWALNTRIQSQGLKSDSCTVTSGDTTYLTSNTFSTIGKYSVILRFDQICKTEFYDRGFVQYSTDGGITYSNAGINEYLGNGTMYITGITADSNYAFCGLSYVDWDLSDSLATDTMWQSETFDLTDEISDEANVKIRFMLIDGAFSSLGNKGFPGWFLDSITVDATFSEMVPPEIALINPYPKDTMFLSNPYVVTADVTDDSGIDTVMLAYSLYPEGVIDTLPMVYNATISAYQCFIPFYGYGRTTTYQIIAIDGSAAHNITTNSPTSFYSEYSEGGTVVVGNGSNNSTYPFYTLYMDARTQMIYTAAELNALGIYGGSITEIGFKVATVGSPAMNGFSIKMKNFSGTTINGFQSGAVQVYSSSSYTPTVGWNMYTLSSSFAWDGSSSLLVEVCYDNGAWSSNSTVKSTPKLGKTWHAHTDNSVGCTLTGGSGQSNRPNLKLVIPSSSSITKDMGVTVIEHPNSGILANTDSYLDIKATNFGTDTITDYKIYYSLNGAIQDSMSVSNVQISQDSVVDIRLDTLNVPVGSYYLKTWTESPNDTLDMNFGNDTSSFFFYACTSLLHGTYTIGGSNPDYATFADATLALNQCGMDAPVTFSVAPGVYTDHMLIYPVNGSSATNTITFQSSTGDSSDVVLKYDAMGAADNYVIKLMGTPYFTFKNMSFVAADSNYARVFDLRDGVHDFKIENCVVKASVNSTTSINRMHLIYAIDSIGDNFVLKNSAFINGATAIHVLSKDSSSNVLIENNIINGFYSNGIHLYNTYNPITSGNIITQSTIASNGIFYGIHYEDAVGVPIVKYNKVVSTISPVGIGLRITRGKVDTAARGLVYNNFFRIHGSGNSGTTTSGILLSNTPNMDIYYNNVLITGNHSNSAAFYILNTSSRDNVAKNNIFVNKANGYAFYVKSVGSATFETNFNDYYAEGSRFASIKGTSCSSLSALVNKTVSDTNSISIDPYYIGATDLHIVNNAMDATGTPIAGITEDIDGDIRNTTTPDMGADEFDKSPWDLSATVSFAPVGACGLSSSEVVSFRIINIGTATVNGNYTANFSYLGSTVVSETINTVLNSGDTLDYTFTNTADLDVSTYGKDSTFNFKIWVNLANDPIHFNDTIYSKVDSRYQPLAPITSPATCYFANSTIITATSPDSLSWYASDTASNALANANNFNTGLLYDTTVFYVEASSGGGVFKMTETVQYKGGSGSTNPYPSYLPSDFDGVEITNMGNGSGNLSGYKIFVKDGSTLLSYTFPAGTIVNSGEVVLAIYGSTLTVGPAGNNVFNINTYSGIYSSSSVAYWLKDAIGNVVDAFASNGASFPATSGVVPSDFTGSFPNGSSKAGAIRIVSDNNSASDWVLKGGGTAASFGSFNSMLTLSGGFGACVSPRVSLQVNVIGFPSEDAGISSIVNPLPLVYSGVNQDVKVVLSNYGLNTLTNTDILYQYNGAAPDTFKYVGSLAYHDKDTVTLETKNFSSGYYSLKTWTENPNNLTDTINTNDTSKVDFIACLHGVYTIGSAAGSTFDFPTVTDAVNALNTSGISGNVVFKLDTGVFDERFIINDVVGIGPNAGVTFTSINGDSSQSTIHFNTNASAIRLIQVKSSNITFENLTLSTLGGATNGKVFELVNACDNFTVRNCVLIGIDPSTLASSGTSYTVFNVDNSSHDSITVENCEIKNGTYSILVEGPSNMNSSIYINNNYIHDFNNFGIAVKNNKLVNVKNNNLVSSSFGTNKTGIYLDKSKVINITKNELRLYPSGVNGKSDGIKIKNIEGISNNIGLVANNYLYFGSGQKANKGIILNNTKYVDIVYNTIHNSYGSFTNRGIDISSYGSYFGVNIINNIVRDSLGYVAYVTVPSNVDVMDHNVYYTESSNFAYWSSSNQADLAALKAASSKEYHSVVADPVFNAIDSVHLSTAQLSSYGLPISNVTDDIDGEIRGTTSTTPGADEYGLIHIDVGVLGIYNFPSGIHESQNVSFSAIVKNAGTDTVNSFIIEYKVNNGTTVGYNYTSTLAPLSIDTVALSSFIAPAGNSNICVKTVLTGDLNIYNNEKCFNFYSQPTKDLAIISISPMNQGCSLTTDTVSVVIKNYGLDTINLIAGNTPTIHYINDLGAGGTVVNGIVNMMIYPGATANYEFSTQVDLTNTSTSDSLFTVAAWVSYNGDNVTNNDTITYDVVSAHTPTDPIFTSPVYVPYGSLVSMTATTSPSDSIFWYNLNNSTSLAHIGKGYTTPYLYSDDTLYLQAKSRATSPLVISEAKLNGFNHVEVQNILDESFDATGWSVVISNSYIDINERNADMWSLGVFAANTAQWKGDTYGSNDWGAEIKWLPNENGWAMIIDDLGFVRDFVIWGWSSYDIQNMSVNVPSFPGRNPNYPEQKWIGAGYDNSCGTTIYRISNAHRSEFDFSCRVEDQGVANIIEKVNRTYECVSNKLPLDIYVSAQSPVDVGVVRLEEPYSDNFLNTLEAVTVTLKNFGTTYQSNIPVSYILDSSTVVTEVISNSIAPGDTFAYTFSGTVDLGLVGHTYQMKAYSGLSGDMNHSNDTVISNILNMYPNYCISTANYNNVSEIVRVKIGSLLDNHSIASGKMYTNFMQTVSPAILQVGATSDISIETDIAPGYQYSASGWLKVFIDLNRDGDFDDAGETVFSQASAETSYLDGVYTVPATAQSGYSAMRVVHRIYGDASSTNSCGTYAYGETEDYLVYIAPRIQFDAGVEKIISPEVIEDDQSPDLIVRVRNFGYDTLTTFEIKYKIDTGAVVTYNYTGSPILPLGFEDVNIGTIPIGLGTSIITAFTNVAGDSLQINDTIVAKTFVQSIQQITYTDDFDQANFWFNDTIQNQWELGTPATLNINSTHSGINAWVTNLYGNYRDNSFEKLYSPIFVVPSNVDSVYLKFWNFMDCGADDGGYMQYKSGKYGVWKPFGYAGDPYGTNWYNTNNGGTHMWSHSNSGWMLSEYLIKFNDMINPFYGVGDTLEFRFVFYSDNAGVNTDGWAIDDFELSLATIPNDVGITSIISPIDSTQSGSSISVEVEVTNFGTANQTSIPVSYTIGNNPVVNETFTPSGSGLAPNTTQQFTFTANYPSPGTDYSICIQTNLTGDIYNQNDKMCKSVHSTLAAIDVGVVSVIASPTKVGTTDSTGIANNNTVTIKIVNYGVNVQTSIPVSYTTSNVTKTGTWTGSLALGDTATYIFTDKYKCGIGAYQLCATTILANDAGPSNDEYCNTYIGYDNVGFEDVYGIGFIVNQNEPNPAYGTVNISFVIPQSGEVHFDLKNDLGQIIKSNEETYSNGTNNMKVDVSTLSNGVYYYTIEFDGKRITRKMIVNQ